MKIIIFAIWVMFFFLSASVAQAETCQTERQVSETTEVFAENPEDYMKDAPILVQLKNGKVYKFNTNTHKVVLREGLVVYTQVKETKSCRSDKLNRLSLVGGQGTKDGLDKTITPNQVDVSNTQGLVMGVQYQRTLNDTFSLGVQHQNNKTNSVLLGVDF